jgi:hypothetical protein
VRLSGTVTGNVVIRRPVHVVYSFYRSFTNLPVTVTITGQRANQLVPYQTCGPTPQRGRREADPSPSIPPPEAHEGGSSSWCRSVPSDAPCWP